ncbi:hypothetical protein OF829_13750 [Sphingomonas sp. LB-2]|uniref:surface-adhesin E family protein n=1 Tax=Sphingomonas caeni TaxID=2984949 RepID=UPI00222F2408|nr:surface-adhesin E family protein [Sphingomonas caeni]MCW3848305.1 hypothetical protein [Sphingomonas caeni]
MPGEDWVLISEAENGVVFSLDRDSVREMDGYRQAWTRTDYSKVSGGDVSLRRALEDYDCGGRRLRTRGSVAYGRDGKVLRTMSLAADQSEWKAVEPGSMGEAKLDAVCAVEIKATG